jgi:glycosyltransferase involved in cell wall biosynthesis
VAERPLTRALLVHREDTASTEVTPLLAALAGLPVETIVAEQADDADLERVAAAPLAVFADLGDAWGLLGGAALAGGALVVAPAGSPFLETVPPDACVVTGDAAAAADAIRTIRADPAAFSSRGPRAAREMSRIASDVQAGRRIRELGRVLIHGVVDPRTLEMTVALAATMNERSVAHV